ncbi:MAG: MFS transporter [Pseudomonadales bacterium]|nr:MFS transporter [Gammaproteobacteria bacterium]NNL56497.1 MFS transporter [Pseudomonadales bacterium]
MLQLLRKPGAAVFYLAIFLNALVDLGHKITIQNVIFKVHDGAEQVVLTAVVNALILLPYVVFVIPVGRVANRVAKPYIMRAAAWASLLLLFALAIFYRLGWFWPAFVTTFAMAIQSAFFSPAKLAYLKVLFSDARLAAANGLAQSIVIVGILAGTVLFSLAFEALYSLPVAGVAQDKNAVLAQMPALVVVLFVFVLLQLLAVYRIPVLDEFTPLQPAATRAAGSPALDVSLRAILGQRKFLLPIIGLALFWSVGQAMLAIFPAYAKARTGITNTAVIQGILTCTGLGIIAGAWLVERYTSRIVNLRLVLLGIVLMSTGLFAILFINSAVLFACNYFLLGIASGLLIVPLNAYLQYRSHAGNIGSVIACSNLLQNIAMLGMLGCTIAVALAGLSPARLLLLMAIGASVVGLLLSRPLLGLQASVGASGADLKQ